jgi:hypothetical protein
MKTIERNNRIMEIIRFLTNPTFRKNRHENRLIEDHLERLGVAWSFPIEKCWEEYDQSRTKGMPRVSSGCYAFGASGRVHVLLKDKKDRLVAAYEIRNSIVSKRMAIFR